MSPYQNVSLDGLLNFALNHDMLDVSRIYEAYDEEMRKECLKNYTITKNKDGYYSAHYVDLSGKRKTIRRAKKKDIETFLIKLLKNQEENPTVKEIFEKVQEDKLNLDHRKESTILRNYREFKKSFQEISSLRIRGIDEQVVETFLINTKREHDMTAKEYSNVKVILKSILFEADRKRYIDFDFERAINRADYINRNFKSTKYPDELEVFTQEQEQTLIQYLSQKKTPHTLGLLLLFYTGLRIGELAVLKWSDIKDGFINIHATETESKKGLVESNTPKTDAANRNIPIPPDAEWIFDYLKEKNPSNEYIFTYNNRRITTVGFRRILKESCEKCNIPYKKPHKIRKTYATKLREHNVSDYIIMDLLGHTNINITNQFYIKRRTNINQKKEVINQVFS